MSEASAVSAPSLLATTSQPAQAPRPGQQQPIPGPGGQPSLQSSERLKGTATAGGDVFVKIFSLTTASGGKGAPGGQPEKVVSLGSMAITTLRFQGDAKFGEKTTLADVRVRLAGTLNKKHTFKFCVDDCSVVPEDLTIDAYSKMLRPTGSRKETFIRIYIAATKEPASSQTAALLGKTFVLKFTQIGATTADSLNVGSLHSSAFKGQNPSAMPLGELRRLIGKMSSNPQMHTFCSADGTTAGDELTLQQYLSLDATPVGNSEGTPVIIIRFRKADAKVPAEGSGSKFHGASQEVLNALKEMKPNLELKDFSAQEFKADLEAWKPEETLQASDIAARDASILKQTSQMDEADWDTVLRNCSLLYGWKINKLTNKIERATTPAFRLRAKTPPTPIAVPSAPQNDISPLPIPSAPKPEGTARPTDIPAGTSPSSDTVEVRQESSSPALTKPKIETPVKPLTAEDVHAAIPVKLGAVPAFTVNDHSKIEVTSVTTEFQESMARNNFSTATVEATISGGYRGVSVGFTGGNVSETAKMENASKKQYAKRMIGRYMFPRVSVFLRPEDLEPTQELREALNRVRRSKNINDLRKLYATFGHLFCDTATLGGALQTTKIIAGEETKSHSKEKEDYKAEVGAAVSTPWGIGGSAKRSKQKTKSGEDAGRDVEIKETMAFEATGGNTILAADPPAWSSSVADFNNWRVIDQSEPVPITEILSQIQGMQDVKAWFFAAVPKLSEYIVIPDSRTLHVRFRLAAAAYGAFERVAGTSDQAYLGHDPDNAIMPIRRGLTTHALEAEIQEKLMFGTWGPVIDMTLLTKQKEETQNHALFYPYCTQAPALLFPSGKEVGSSNDTKFSHCVWRLEIPHGHSLGPDTLISIKSTSSPKHDLTLSVYRNAQGVFLPCISSTDEPSYWRLQRAPTPSYSSYPLSAASTRHRNGDPVRLTWSFADQTSGFRDFVSDPYGRRSFRRPAELGSGMDTLCLKAPYPRFETATKEGGGAMGLVMSPALTSEPIVEAVRLRRVPTDKEEVVRNYNLFDLVFWLDSVGNDGKGDQHDFMNVVAEGDQKIVKTTEWNHGSASQNALRSVLGSGGPQDMLAGVLLGPGAAPIAGIGRVIAGIFDFL